MNRVEYLQQQTARREARRPVKKVTIHVIKPRSKKRIKSDEILSTIRMTKIAEDNICKIQSEVCTGFATVLNHKQKTSPKNRLQEDNLEQCCVACNNWIEINIEWAKSNGHQISRFAK